MCVTIFQWSSFCIAFVIVICHVFDIPGKPKTHDDELIEYLKQLRHTTPSVKDILKLERYNGSALEQQIGLLSPLLIETEAERRLLESYQNTMAVKKDNGLKLQTMKLRAEALKQRCSELQNIHQREPTTISPQNNKHVFVIPRYKLAICINHNVASYNLYRAILILTGAVKTTDPKVIPDSAVMALASNRNTTSEISDKEWRDYKKVVFVREPMERLVSIFVDKFKLKLGKEDINDFNHTIVGIKKRLRPLQDVKMDQNLTFNEFVRYILHPNTIGDGLDSQWDTYTSACTPCDTHYDYVGTCNSFGQEISAILNDVGASALRFSANGVQLEPITETDLVKFYKKIPNQSLETAEKHLRHRFLPV